MNKQPTFLLRSNPTQLFNRYKNGEFFRPVPVKSKITLARSQLTHSSLYKGEELAEYVKTNEKEVEMFYKNGCQNIKGGRCDYCKQDFETERVGYPLAYEHKSLLKNNIYKNVHVFWIDGCFCNYSCCLSYIKLIKPTIVRDTNMQDVEVLLRYMCRLDTNVTTLKESPPPIDNINPNATYTKTSAIVKIPAQIVYSKLI